MMGVSFFCGIRDVKKEFEAILENPQKETYEKLFEDYKVGRNLTKANKYFGRRICSSL